MIMRLDKNELLYVSKSIRGRLKGLLRNMCDEHISYAEVAHLTSTNQHTVYLWVMGKLIPSLLQYLNLAALMEWDITRDVNRWYVEGLITRDEIYRRAMRLYPQCSSVASLIAEMSCDMKISSLHVWKLFASHTRPSALIFGATIHHIMRLEHDRAYNDTLDIEE